MLMLAMSSVRNSMAKAGFESKSAVKAHFYTKFPFSNARVREDWISTLCTFGTKKDEAEYNRQMALCDLEKTNDPAPAYKIENKSHAAIAPIDPSPQKQSVPFVADAGRGNAIWPILLTVLGGIVLVLIVAVVIIACE